MKKLTLLLLLIFSCDSTPKMNDAFSNIVFNSLNSTIQIILQSSMKRKQGLLSTHQRCHNSIIIMYALKNQWESM